VPGPRKTHPEMFVDYETIQDAIARAQATRSVVHAWISGRAYRVYPERYERRPHEDKILLAEPQRVEPRQPRSSRRKAS
jgi:hypothetical protein